jgi:excisionase family DNA binding protein
MHVNYPSVAGHSELAVASTNSEAQLPRLAYSITNAAIVSGLSRSTLYVLMKAGLPSVKIGSRRLIRHDDLVALLDHLTS